MVFLRLVLLIPCMGLLAQPVRVSVFGLFHPSQLTVRSATGNSIIVHTALGVQTLEGSQVATFSVNGTSQADVTSPSGAQAEVILTVPAKIERRYHGTIHISRSGSELLATVDMDREVAVASIVAAEIPAGAPLEALKAQAVIARSFLAASKPRHRGYQFCDTTHCQFLRAWPDSHAVGFQAARDTRGFLLTFDGLPMAPLYSAVCGGHTLAFDSPQPGSSGYCYRAVRCAYCVRNPQTPRGHRLGMCQEGASDMARHGAGFRDILNHYYPGTAVTKFSAQ